MNHSHELKYKRYSPQHGGNLYMCAGGCGYWWVNVNNDWKQL